MDEMKAKMRQMVDEAIKQLKIGPPSSIMEQMRQMAGKQVAPLDNINWPSGLLAQALVAYYWNNLNAEISLVIKHALIKYYQRFIKSKQGFHYLDNAQAGYALIDLHQITEEEGYKTVLDNMVAYLKEHPVDDEGSLPYRPWQSDYDNGNLHIYADGIGMTCPFLARYGHTYDDPGSIALAVKQILNFCKNGMDSRTGLPYHGYDFKSKISHGIIGFGRACGWLMIGMVECLIYMDQETTEFEEIKQHFRRLVDKVEAYQRDDGFYPWLLTAKEGHFDTSATAMISYAIARGLQHDIIISIHRSRMLRGRDALLTAVDEGKIFDCLTEHGGFGIYPQVYEAYPWSLGPTLSLCSVQLKELFE
jgi:rhamnogalacturonyl hydrolase YesR